MSERPEGQFCQVTIHERTPHGRVLEIAPTAPASHEAWSQVREVMKREVERHDPTVLVIDLRALDSLVGMPLIGALVVGASAMRELGIDRQTRLVATSPIAAPLADALRVARIDFLFGGTIHPSIEAALTEGG